MARFPRPFNALTADEYNALPFGTPIWTVYGHLKPTQPPKEYARQAKATNIMYYKDHPEFFEESTQRDLQVFDLAYIKKDGTPEILHGKLFTSKDFVNDYNMVEGVSYNDNYMFTSYEDALVAYHYFVALHNEFPQPHHDDWLMDDKYFTVRILKTRNPYLAKDVV